MIVEQRFRAVSMKGPRDGTASGRSGDRALFIPNPKLKLREQVHEVMRFFHYSPRTEETYWHWIERFLKFHRRPLIPPATMEHLTPDPSPHPMRRGEPAREEKSDAVHRVPARNHPHLTPALHCR